MPEDNSARLAAKANRLYWQTSRPAGRLADELGISRSKFYALLEPLKLERKCPDCGAPLAFGSRSDREAGRGRCSACGASVNVPAEPMRAPVAEPPAAESGGGDARGWLQLPGTRQLWITAIAGIAAGILITTAWRRR